MPSPQERKEKPVTVQTGTKLEAFFAAFSRKTRVLRRKSHREAIWNGIFASWDFRKLQYTPSIGRVL